MTLSEIYLPDLLTGVAGAAIIALLLMVFLPRLMGADVAPLSATPIYFYWLAPLLAGITSVALYLIDNSTQMTIITWSVVAGVGAVATLTDFKDHRAPNILSYNQFVLVAVSLVINAFLTGNFFGLMWAGISLVGAAVLTLLAVVLLKVGVGDFKFIPVIAAALGFVSPWLAVAWLITSYVLNTMYALGAFVFHDTEKNGPRSKAKAAMIPPFYFGLWVLVGVVYVGMVTPLA